jgi:hypothetical protein
MMHSVNIQFHMLFEELVEFVSAVSTRYQLEIELERFYPNAVRLVSVGADISEEIRQFGQVDRFWLLYKAPRSKRAEKFMLNVGRQRGDRLAQAQLGAGADKAAAFEVLKRIASDLKRTTTAGMWLLTENGNFGYVKNARVSEGARNAALAGKVNLVGIAFSGSFRVIPPDGKCG